MMELEEFVKKVLVDINKAVDAAGSESSRRLYFSARKDGSTVEFDIAVSAEQAVKGSGKAGVKVLSVIEGGGEYEKIDKSSTASRVKFGVNIHPSTKSEEETFRASAKTHNSDGHKPLFRLDEKY